MNTSSGILRMAAMSPDCSGRMAIMSISISTFKVAIKLFRLTLYRVKIGWYSVQRSFGGQREIMGVKIIGVRSLLVISVDFWMARRYFGFSWHGHYELNLRARCIM
jgi:hypothetical protein